MAEKINFKPLIIGMGIVFVLTLLFRARIGSVEYKDIKIPVFRFVFEKNDYFVQWALKTTILETEYGDITIKPFCNLATTYYDQLSGISWPRFKRKRATHNLNILGTQLDPVIGVSFTPKEDYRIESIVIPYLQEFSFNDFMFYTKMISLFKEIDNEELDETCFLFIPDSNKIILSDQTEIEFFDLYDRNEDYDIMPYNLSIISDGTWHIFVSPSSNKYLMVKRPEWPEAKKCTGIEFDSNWGKYLDSKELEETTTSLLRPPSELDRLIENFRRSIE